jgi:hypothetical protein
MVFVESEVELELARLAKTPSFTKHFSETNQIPSICHLFNQSNHSMGKVAGEQSVSLDYS